MTSTEVTNFDLKRSIENSKISLVRSEGNQTFPRAARHNFNDRFTTFLSQEEINF